MQYDIIISKNQYNNKPIINNDEPIIIKKSINYYYAIEIIAYNIIS